MPPLADGWRTPNRASLSAFVLLKLAPVSEMSISMWKPILRRVIRAVVHWTRRLQ